MAKKTNPTPTQRKAIYITWHYTTHGIAYMKHILTAFYRKDFKIGDEQSKPLDQEKLQTYWDNPNLRVAEDGFLFEKVFYLACSDDVTKQVSWRRRKGRMEDDEVMQANDTWTIWNDLSRTNEDPDKERTIAEEAAYLQATYPEKWAILAAEYWRSMQYYKIDEQLYWWQNMSNGRHLYDEKRLEKVLMPVKNLRDIQDIAENVRQWVDKIRKKYADYDWVINTSLGSYEAQTVWYALGEAGYLPLNTHFISTYDDKSSNDTKRFKFLTIKKQPVQLFSDIRSKHLSIYDKATASRSRLLAQAKFKHYIHQGFTMLLLGERGTGKTRLILEAEENKVFKKVAKANCASFDDDNKAEADLFGYEKGAFTGADRDKEGLFHEANGGLLFLDEVHNLSRRVQAKLMTALQTNDKNEFRIRRLKSSKEETVKCTIVFASNQSIEKLRKRLYPDLFDRITQLIVEFPPLRKVPEERLKDWESIWRQLQFDTLGFETPKEPALINWLRDQDLTGNYRDLQKIAIYYKTFLDIQKKADEGDKDAKDALELIDKANAFEFAKSEFELYYSAVNRPNPKTSPYFASGKSSKEILKDFKYDFAQWAIHKFGNEAKAAAHFQTLHGDTLTERTIFNWKIRDNKDKD
jgi:transcriptional regulator with AAA-type ATPase domain